MTKGTVLIIDDNPDNLSVLSDFLFQSGFRPLIAQNGKEGMHCAKKAIPDIILLDVMMSEMDGYDTCKALKRSAETRDIPIIFLSALMDVDDKVRAFENGAVDYITKPFRFREVLSRLSLHMDLQRKRKELDELNKQLRRSNMDLQKEIEERKQTELRLMESENLYKGLFENSLDAIIMADGNGRYIEANPAACGMLKYSREELITMGVEDIVISEDKAAVRKQWDKFIKKGKDGGQSVLKTKDGGRVEVDYRAVANVVDNVHISVLRDITEYNQTLDSLRNSEYDLWIQNQIATIFLTSSEDSLYREIIDILLKALNSDFGLFGYIDETGDLVCKSISNGVWESCRVKDKKIVFTKDRWGGIWGHSLTMKKSFYNNDGLTPPEGHVSIKNALATPILYHDQLVGQFTVANKAGGYNPEDVRLLEMVASRVAPILHAKLEEERHEKEREEMEANKKRLETQLLQTQKMEAVGVLAGGIAHDFNNILFPIIGYVEMMLEDVVENDDFRFSLNEVLAASHRAKELIKQILAFSRQNEQERKPIRIQSVIKEVLQLARSTLPSTIEIVKHIQETGNVMADPAQLYQVFMNLITNSFHAMQDTGGTLTIQVDERHLGKQELDDPDLNPGKYVRIVFSDTGMGLDPSIIERIFDPYFTTKSMGKGTGLGLSVVLGIVKSHGGKVEVAGTPGKGAKFTIYFPVMEIKGQDVCDMDDVIERGHETILFVDDEEQIAVMVQRMLERLGYVVSVRTSSTDALEAFRANPRRYDLVITDMTMPFMTGTRLTMKLREIRSDIPIIICTGYSELINEEAVEEMGISGYVMKPVLIAELSKAIRKALNGRESC